MFAPYSARTGGPLSGPCAVGVRRVVVAVVVGMPLVTAAHAPVAVRYRVTGTIPVGSCAGGMAVDPGTHTAYVIRGGDSVSVIDAATGTVTGTIPVGDDPAGVLVRMARRP